MKKHTEECRWEKTTDSQCEYRDTHHYCPHPEHECNCEGVKPDIKQVCAPCGISANVLTCLEKYKRSPKQLAFSTSTMHTAKCDVCGDETSVTECRDFFYPDFSLLLAKMNK